MFLTNEQTRFFRHSGYIKLSQKVELDVVNQMREITLKHTQQRVQPYQVDQRGQVYRLDAVIQRAKIFEDLFCSSIVLDPLESLLGPNIEIALNRHNHVTLNLAGSTPSRLHRDVLQWSRSLVTAIVYLDESTPETGCTYIIPGSQYLPFVGTPNNGGTWMDEHSVYADLIGQAVPIPMEKGGILLFDSLAFHTVGVNKTEESRMSVCIGYHSVDELQGAGIDPKKMLMRGTRLYRGNDQVRTPNQPK